jgi:hypothetical protein
VGDNYSAEWVGSAFRQCGIGYRRSDMNRSQLYLEALPLFTRGQLSIPDHPKLLRELRLLERHTHRSGRDTVDHGRINGNDDYSNALVGMLRLNAGKYDPDEGLPYWYRYTSRYGGFTPEQEAKRRRKAEAWRDEQQRKKAGIANPQSVPCTLKFEPEKPLPEGLLRRGTITSIW